MDINKLIEEYRFKYFRWHPYPKGISLMDGSPSFHEFLRKEKGFKSLKIRFLLHNSLRVTKKKSMSLTNGITKGKSHTGLKYFREYLTEDMFNSYEDFYWFRYFSSYSCENTKYENGRFVLKKEVFNMHTTIFDIDSDKLRKRKHDEEIVQLLECLR